MQKGAGFALGPVKIQYLASHADCCLLWGGGRFLVHGTGRRSRNRPALVFTGRFSAPFEGKAGASVEELISPGLAQTNRLTKRRRRSLSGLVALRQPPGVGKRHAAGRYRGRTSGRLNGPWNFGLLQLHGAAGSWTGSPRSLTELSYSQWHFGHTLGA